MLTAAGIGSGLDLELIISQLMSLEQIPLQNLQAKQSGFEAQISAYGRLSSAFSDFQSKMGDLKSLSDFEIYSPTSGDEDVFTVTADENASVGVFDIGVVQLAESHKIGSLAMADTATVGTSGDTMTLTVDGTDLVIDAGGKTLAEIADAINASTDNPGVTASILSESEGQARLILTSDNTGVANNISYSFSDPALGTDLGFTDINTALDSIIEIDGFTVTRSSNSIDDAINGVTIDLKSVSELDGASNPITTQLKVDRDFEAVKENVQSFVDAYNTVQNLLKDLRGGELQGDSTVRSIENQLRDVFNTAPTGLGGDFEFLSEIGVSFDASGSMTLDSDDLETAMTADFQGVADLFANDDQGYVFRLDAIVDSITDTDGAIEARTDGLQSSVDYIDTQIANEEYRLEITEERLRAQFSALDALIGQMQGTLSFLSAQLG